jgi:hypothetical protein
MARKKLIVGTSRTAANGNWVIEIDDPATLVTGLGEPLVAAFCQCFIHVDRISALTAFGALSDRMYGHGTVAHERNLHAMFWYVAGTLFELQHAIGALRSALGSAGLFNPRMKGWRGIGELHSWSKTPLLKRLRNKLAYHVDRPEIIAGLREVVTSGKPWILARGDDNRMETTQIPMGYEPLLRGLKVNGKDMRELVRGVARRQRVPGSFQLLFLAVLSKRGLGLRTIP